MKRKTQGEAKKGLISFFPPNTGGNLDEWEFRCPKWKGGCGRLHALNLDWEGEFDLIEPWDTGEHSCRLTNPYGSTHDYDYAEVVELVKGEWQEHYRQQHLREIDESEEQEKKAEQENSQQEKIKAGVKLEERQYEREWGNFRPVGFYKQRQEIFVCGNCSKNLAGAGKHAKAKNRNNPVFWGLEVKEKVLCLACVKNYYYGVISRERKKVLRKYLQRGYV